MPSAKWLFISITTSPFITALFLNCKLSRSDKIEHCRNVSTYKLNRLVVTPFMHPPFFSILLVPIPPSAHVCFNLNVAVCHRRLGKSSSEAAVTSCLYLFFSLLSFCKICWACWVITEKNRHRPPHLYSFLTVHPSLRGRQIKSSKEIAFSLDGKRPVHCPGDPLLLKK